MQMRPLALPFLLIPGVASADVTPQDVWDNMVAGYGAAGFVLSATLEASGDTLIANDGSITVTYPVIGGQAVVTMPPMTLTAQGDGTVRIDTPATYVASLTADIPEETEQVSVDVTIAMEGLNSVASGDPGDVVYTTDATSFDMLASNLVIPGEAMDPFELQFDSDGYASVTRVTVDDVVTITNEATNRPAVMSFNIGADGFRQESTSNTGTMISSVNMVLPDNIDIMNLAPAFRAGMSISGSTQSEGGTSDTKSFDGDELLSEQTQVTGASTATFGMDAAGLRIEGAGEGGNLTLEGSEFMLPFPIELTFGAASGNVTIPLLAEEVAQPFAYGFSVSDLTVADDLWNLIDAGNNLDRSPISMTFDISGEMNVSSDLVDPATYEAIDAGVIPVEPTSLAINEIALGALGAAITASGAFTIDNTDLATFGGMPRPEGSATASATGLNAAMDQLIAAGLLGEQDVTMPRMFMGMFAVSQGDDALTTEVEINAEGHVLLNGQRIQ